MSRSLDRQTLVVALVVLVVGISAWTTGTVLSHFPVAADLHIPLEAARRWMAGGTPYVSEAFTNLGGYGLPFLYPPFVLPLVAPLTLLPEAVVGAAWLAAAVLVSLFACRRLGFPWWAAGL